MVAIMSMSPWGPFSQPLDVMDFPFDTQDFEVRLACANYEPDEVQFVSDPEERSGIADQFSLPDWRILKWELDFQPYNPARRRVSNASFAFVLHARRYAAHFIWKVILPLTLIVVMSWVVFWIDPKESGTQISAATTSMLTLIAYRFMVDNLVPVVPYLTRMDHFILGSTLLVFAALVQAVVTSIVARRDAVASARRVDVWCRVCFPVAFVAILIFSLVA